MKLVECVPNFSEGRRPDVIAAIHDAIAAVAGVTILDVSSDVSHNRTVITFVVTVDAAVDAAYAGIAKARELIDLTVHRGEHPRLGATDVVPFVPLESWGSTMQDCIALARSLGERVAAELAIPVYLYERAATRPDRENLADVRRGEFEGLRDEITTNASRVPDFGDARIHPTAGAVIVGARPFLVAYNVYLGPASNVAVAKDVAKAVRGSSGGLRFVKALGLEVDGQAQVSMNLVDTGKTPLYRAYEMVKQEAASLGVATTWSELVGLVPERAMFEAGARHIQLRGFSPAMILEQQVRNAVAGGQSMSGFAAAIASPVPTPGGGSVAAHAGALSAALTQMVAGLTVGKKKYAAVEGEMQDVALQAAALGNRLAALVADDASAYELVAAAYKLPKESAEAIEHRARTIGSALLGAARVPLETARAAAEAAELAAAVAARGNTNAVTDAGVAALLAEAACKGAAYNVRVNVVAMDDRSVGEPFVLDAAVLVARATGAREVAELAVERVLVGGA